MPTISDIDPMRSIKKAAQTMSERSDEFLRKAKHRLQGPRLTAYSDGFDCLAGKRHPLPVPIGSNGRARKVLARSIYKLVRSLRRADPSIDIGWGTIINQGWETSDERTVVPVGSIQAETRPTLTAMGTGFLFAVEVQAFANIRHEEGGKLLTPHIHGIVIGRNIRERAEAVAQGHQGRFVSRFSDMAPVAIDWINDDVSLAYAVCYMLKLSPRTKTYYRSPKGREHDNLHESEAGDRYIRYTRLMQIQAMMDLRRIVYAGGLLKSVRAQAFRDVAAHLKDQHDPHNRPIHPDGIPHFLLSLNEELNESRFKLPLVLYS